MKTLFLHGWNSIPGSVKPTYLDTHRHTRLNESDPSPPQLNAYWTDETARVSRCHYTSNQTRIQRWVQRWG